MATGDLKIDRINGAYSLLRISGITVEPTPENNKLDNDLGEGTSVIAKRTFYAS